MIVCILSDLDMKHEQECSRISFTKRRTKYHSLGNQTDVLWNPSEGYHHHWPCQNLLWACLPTTKKVCCMRKSTTFKSGLRYCLFIGIELCVFADMSAKVFSNNWNLSGIARTNISFFKNKLVIAIQKISLNQMFCGEFFKSNHKRSV